MGLGDLTLEGMEMYGGIEMKKNGKKSTLRGFGVSVGIHLLVILLYFVWTAIAKEDDKKIPHVRKISSLAELAPPPSTEDNSMAAPLPTAPSVDIAKPTFGIPVPVPDMQAPNQTMPDLNNIPAQQAPAGDGGGGSVQVGNGGEVHVAVPETVEESTPDKDAFVDLSDEPKPVQNIQSLVVYPEVAKRTNLEGKVTCDVLIGKDGKVQKVDVVKTDNEIFNSAAKDAFYKARFTPGRQNGTPVTVWQTISIVFKLSK